MAGPPPPPWGGVVADGGGDATMVDSIPGVTEDGLVIAIKDNVIEET